MSHHLYVFGLRGLPPSEDEVEAPEDVLRQVDALGSLRNASQGHRGDSARQTKGGNGRRVKTAASRQRTKKMEMLTLRLFLCGSDFELQSLTRSDFHLHDAQNRSSLLTQKVGFVFSSASRHASRDSSKRPTTAVVRGAAKRHAECAAVGVEPEGLSPP